MKRNVLDKGFVELLDVMGSDADIVKAARVSYSAGDESRKRSDDRGLIRYLMSNYHTSPFEMAELKFHVKAPIFVARQWVRHRTASWNEISGRYSELTDEYHTPAVWRGQGSVNKQGSEGLVDYDPAKVKDGDVASWGRKLPEFLCFQEYHDRLDVGVAREQARGCLPLSTYTEWVWKIDLHNLFGFLRLRMDPHAQEEIRVYADAIAEMVRVKFPLSYEAFTDYRLEAMSLSRLEQRALRVYFASTGAPDEAEMQLGMSDREWSAFIVKCEKLGVL
jgi:thymidylate synthase (FAD)